MSPHTTHHAGTISRIQRWVHRHGDTIDALGGTSLAVSDLLPPR